MAHGLTEMEQMAILAMSAAHVDKLTEDDANDIYGVGASFVPAEALLALGMRYPTIMFRHFADIPCNILKEVARQFPEQALVYGLADEVEVSVIREILRNDPEKLVYLRDDFQHDLFIDEPFALEISKVNPLATLRYAAARVPKKRVIDIGLTALQDKETQRGYAQAYWSSLRLDTSSSGSQGLKHCNFRLFTTQLGCIGQGWLEAMSQDRTNMREAGLIYCGENNDFYVEAVKYTIENVTPEQGEALARSSILKWDLLQMQFPIAPLSDFHHQNGDMRRGTWFYPNVGDKKWKSWDAGYTSGGVGPFVLHSGSYNFNSTRASTLFSVLLEFGTHAPTIEHVENVQKAPYIRVTLLGRSVSAED